MKSCEGQFSEGPSKDQVKETTCRLSFSGPWTMALFRTLFFLLFHLHLTSVNLLYYFTSLFYTFSVLFSFIYFCMSFLFYFILSYHFSPTHPFILFFSMNIIFTHTYYPYTCIKFFIFYLYFSS